MIGTLQTTEIRKQKIAICLMVVFLLTCLCATASFASWSQGFSENGIYDSQTYRITGIEVFKLGGTSSLESPGMSNFSAGTTWTVDMPNSNYVLATNSTPISNFSWLFSFTGTSSDSLHLAYLAYASTGEVFGSYLDFNSGSWSIPTISDLNTNDEAFNRSTPSAVPIPPSVFMLGTGLLCLVGLRRKSIA
ncbi:MAG: hypothetical protein FP814_14030 [Desulfobacterium sp.]|nr:hypothetical protein [Desulfobacterium sp.]MBU3946593.1 hypothetical protein [Pseudomonadota bacterium]MBU4010766.1 hypothetical protein [Pseudomonadota bacterium]MBU4037350.1 hypothetical protein [Pseudomonadota bacterium]